MKKIFLAAAVLCSSMMMADVNCKVTLQSNSKTESAFELWLTTTDKEITAGYDNGYDTQWMKGGSLTPTSVELYAKMSLSGSSDTAWSIIATNSFTTIPLTVMTNKSDEAYKFIFTDVEGNLYLDDADEKKQYAIEEGGEYAFTAATEAYIPTRFTLVKGTVTPSACLNIQAEENVKGIYTIDGRYLGNDEMKPNLPAGMYIINGKKVIK